MSQSRVPASLRRLLIPLSGLCLLWSISTSAFSQTVPSDAKPLCPVTSTKFAGWFQSGSPALNGVVNPADSLNFPNVPNCSFYEWSMQMFLWLTSPTPVTYGGGGGRVFDSKPFFDVSPLDSSNSRHLLAHNEGFLRVFNLQAGFLGPHHLPVIFSKAHRMLEVEEAPTGPNGRPLVLNRSGKAVEIERIVKGKDGKAIFFDTKGRRVIKSNLLHRTFAAPANLRAALVVQRFVIGNRPVFVDPFGNVVDVEQGEAGTGDVLMSQSGSLVYYGIAVNDVYAYFLSGVKDGQISPAPTFPTTAADLAKITAFASAHGVTFPDPNALAVVAKTAWVEASTVPDPGNYVTMVATVPTYVTSDPTKKTWTLSGQKTVQLALVGMHVVGSTQGHPEMIWATFEHVGNTPNDDYVYVNAAGQQAPIARDTSGTWLFSASNAASGFNVPRMRVDSTGNIVASASNTIGPSNTIRTKPWGGAMDRDPNPIAQPSTGNSAASNTEIISINNSVRSMMPTGDVRSNYILTGATWTIGGAGAAGNFPSGNSVGTSQMENTTLETYTQGQDDPAHPTARPETLFGAGANCFDCHSPGLDPSTPDALSHIFSNLMPVSFATLSVRVQVLQRGARHKIQVTVLNSMSGAGVPGASVTVSDSDSGDTLAQGQTAGNGTVTLQYPQCHTLVEPPRGPPRRVPVPCDGSVSASGFADVSFSAP